MSKSISNFAASSALQQITKSYTEYLRVAEREQTTREQIRAQRDVALERIRTQKELWLSYLDRTFDERRVNFEKLFGSLDQAVETGDAALAQGALHTILELAKSSPLQVLSAADASRMLKDPDAEFDVEF